MHTNTSWRCGDKYSVGGTTIQLRAILRTLGMPTSGSRLVLLRRMYMMTLTPLLEMQGAGLTPLNFAICLLRIGGHLGREEALRSIGYISTQRVAPRSGLESLRTGGHLGPEPPRRRVQLRVWRRC